MRKDSDLVSTALAAAALAAAVLLSPWLTRAFQSTDEIGRPLALHASHAARSETCDQRSSVGSTTCAVLQRDRSSGVVTAGADKTF